MRKNPNIELQLDEILCLPLRHYPSTNSCKYTWSFPTRLKNYKKRQYTWDTPLTPRVLSRSIIIINIIIIIIMIIIIITIIIIIINNIIVKYR